MKDSSGGVLIGLCLVVVLAFTLCFGGVIKEEHQYTTKTFKCELVNGTIADYSVDMVIGTEFKLVANEGTYSLKFFPHPVYVNGVSTYNITGAIRIIEIR